MRVCLAVVLLSLFGDAIGLAVVPHSSANREGPSSALQGGFRAQPLSPRHTPFRHLRGGAPSMNMSPDFGMKVLAPLMGNIIGTSMFLSSVPAVLKARKNNDRGSLNITPFAAQIGNCASWLFYAIHIMNWWIIVPNTLGITIAAFYTVATYRLLKPAEKASVTKTLALYAALFAAVNASLLLGILPLSPQDAYGWMANLCLLFFYAAPLTSLADVVKSKDASSIDPLLAGCGVANGAFWAAYGLAIRDPYVWVLNAVGAVLSTFSSGARLAFGDGGGKAK
mmetsp:Transcript_8641/g.22492  ORF Transcript_8641/g.22492 Transcript_8641/m.22492 type:complete len:281 (-) Transcript_8641:216-1058(-)